MKKILYLLITLLINQNVFAQTITKTWRGTTSTNWAIASNWSPSGVPTAIDVISIPDVTNDPIIVSATTTTCKMIFLSSSSILTINSGGTLTVTETSAVGAGQTAISLATGARLINNGTLNGSSGSDCIDLSNDNASFTNNGTANLNSPARHLFFLANNQSVTNNGTMNFNGSGIGMGYYPLTVTGNSIVNTGSINHNSAVQFITLPSSNSFNNSGTINIASTYMYVNGGTFTNQSCGKLYMGLGGDFEHLSSGSVTNNAGMISIAGKLNNSIGSFTNSSGGVLKYGSIGGTITKTNGSIIVNKNPTNTTIFTYQGTFTGAVNGIFTDAGATTSAGTFTAPNTFTPSGLPSGSQTLYAKITPSGGACSYVVPFTYNYVCSQVATATETMTWTGSSGTDWTNPCNWSPNGIPGSGNHVNLLTSAVNQPEILPGLSLTVKSVNIQPSVTLTIAATSTLAVNGGFNVSGSTSSFFNAGTLQNSGTLSIGNNPSVSVVTYGIINVGNGVITNNSTGSISIERVSQGYIYQQTANGTITNYGNITVGSSSNSSLFGIWNLGAFNNTGTIAISNFSSIGFYNNDGTLTNSGQINSTAINDTDYGFQNQNIITNNACGKIIVSKGALVSSGSITNMGLIQIENNLSNAQNFTNNGVLKYSSISGAVAVTNNQSSSIIVKNTPTPIFTYGGTYNGIVNGIYTNAGATTSAGTFTAPNTFVPSGLPTGSQTLYTKITPSGGACSYVVPFTYVYQAPPTLTAGAVTNPTTCGGATGTIAFTTTNVPDGTYSLSFTASGTGVTVSPQNVTVTSNAFTLNGLKAGTYSNFSITVLVQTGTTAISKTLSDPAVPTLTAGTALNPTTCGGTGSIPFTSTNVPDGTYSLSFTATGTGATTSPQSITVTANTFTLIGLKAGTYSSFSITTNNCTGTTATSKTLTDPTAPTLTAGAALNPTTCGGTGSIPFTTTNLANGTYSLSFTATGTGATISPQNITVTSNAFTLNGLKAGTYSSFSITTNNCTGTTATSKTLTDPTAPTLTAGTAVNPTTCGGTGNIPFTTNVPDGTYSLSFTATGTGATTSPQSIIVTANSFTLSGLKAGTYSSFSVTNSGCTGTTATSKTLTAPTAPTLTVGTPVNPTTCGGTGNIPFTTTNVSDGTYSLSFTATGTGATTSPQNVTISGNAFNFNGLKAGTYSSFSITANGCTGTTVVSKTISDPASPTLTAGTAVNPTTCSGTGSIPFTTANIPDGTYSLSFTATGTGATTSPQSIIVTANSFTLSGLKAGTYSSFSVTANSCTGTTVTTRTLTDPATPTLTAGTALNPTTCGGTGNIPFTTTNVPDGTYSLSFTATGTGATTSPQNVTVSGNGFTLNGLKAGNYTNFSLTVNNCTGLAATTRTLSDPASPTLTAGTALNPTTCGGTGSIPFSTTNLPDGIYSLNFTATGTGVTTSPQSITVTANSFTLSGLKAGTYSSFSVMANGCTGTTVTSKTLTDPTAPTLTAGTAVNPTTCSGTGNIPFTTTNVPDGTYSLSFTATGTGATTSPQNVTVSSNGFTLNGLKAGTYSSFSITANGCAGTTVISKTISDPASPTLTAGTAVNPTTCGGTGSIPFTTTNLANGTYSLSFTSGTGATTSPRNITVTSNAFTLNGLKAGNYTNFSLTVNNCTGLAATTRTLSDPASPTLTAGTALNPTTCGGTGSIPFTTTNLPDGIYSLNFTASGTGATTSPQSITVTANSFTLSGLKSGVYSSFSVTNSSCTGTVATSKTLTDPVAPTLTVGTAVNPTTCGGTGNIPFTTTNLPDGIYSLNFTATGTGVTTSPKNVTVLGNAFTLNGLKAGTYSSFSITTSNCTGTTAASKTLTDPTLPTLTAGTAGNPTTCGGTDGSILFTTNLPDGTYSLSYTGTGSPKSITVSGNSFTLSGLLSGGYNNFSVTNNGCTGTANSPKSLNDPAAPVLTLGTINNPTACNLSDGSIAFTTTNIADGTYSLTYNATGTGATVGPKSVTISSNAFTLTGLGDGTYSNFSITNGSGCTGSLATPITLVDLALPVLSVGTAINPTTCSGTEGTITFTTANLTDGSYSLSFTTTGTASPKNITISSNAFILSGLSAGVYGNFSITRSGCTGTTTTSKTLTDPNTPTLTAGTPSNPITCNGTEGTIAFTTTNLSNGAYSLSFITTGTSSPKSVTVTNNTFTLTGLSAGEYSNFSISNNGCTGSDATTKSLNNPPSPSLTAGLVTNPSTCSAVDGKIAFTSTNLPNGSYTVSYTGTGSPKTVTITNNTFDLTGLDDGTYSNFSITYLGCTATSAGSKTVLNPTAPTLTAGVPVNPTTCASTDGSLPFTTTLPNGTYTLNYTGLGSPKSVTVISGAFTLTGLPDGTFSGFSITSSGCTSTDVSSKVLSDPANPTLTLGTAVNPTTCSGSNGSIPFTTSLADGNYTLNYTGFGSPKIITVTSGAFALTGLPAGTYSGFSVTTGGCTGVASGSKTLNDPASPSLTAGLATNPSTCSAADGKIAFTTSLSNGTYTLNYTGSGSPKSITVIGGAFTLTGLPAGIFSGFTVTNNGCTGIDNASKTLTEPATPTITSTASLLDNSSPDQCGKIITYNSSTTGGTSTVSYTFTGATSGSGNGNGSGSFFNVGVTTVTLTATNNCGTGNYTFTITIFGKPTLTLGRIPAICEESLSFAIPFTGSTFSPTTYSISGIGITSVVDAVLTSSPITVSLSTGARGTSMPFTLTVKNSSGCTSADITGSVVVKPTPTIILGLSANPTTCSGTNGSIAFTSTNLPDGTYSLSYTGTDSPKNVTVNNGAFMLTGLSAGDYSNFSITTNGCTGILATIKTLTAPNCIQIVYVDVANTNPTQDGTTWATAFNSLSDGLASAGGVTGTPVEVWVARGTYKTTKTTTRTIYFEIPNDVKVYGGFSGIETTLTDRNFKTNLTTLSGDIGVVNDNTDNSHHIVIFNGSSNNTILDGFNVTGGNANFDSKRSYAAPFNAPTTATIETGGGILVQNAGMPTIANCTILQNVAVTGGGVYAGDASMPKIIFCKIIGNQASFGAALYFQDGSNGTVSNTLISGNKGIGAVYNNISNPTINNVTFGGNGGYNGGIFNSTSQPIVRNSIIWGNSVPFNDTQSIITNSIIQGGYTGTGNLNYDPKYVSPIPEGLSPSINGDYHLQGSSLAIDRGDNTSINLTDEDLDNNLRRFAGGRVDMGAFEFQGVVTSNVIISAQTGDWESNSTWMEQRVPQLGDIVIIDSNHIITINTSATVQNIQYQGIGQLKFKSSTAKLNIGF